jgi:hypothetical protein
VKVNMMQAMMQVTNDGGVRDRNQPTVKMNKS